MKLDKKEFLRTETGISMRSCIQLLDEALEKKSSFYYGSAEY